MAATTSQHQRSQQLGLPLDDHIVDQILGRGGQDKPGRAVDSHQAQSHKQQPPLRPDEGPGLAEKVKNPDFAVSGRSASASETAAGPGSVPESQAPHHHLPKRMAINRKYSVFASARAVHGPNYWPSSILCYEPDRHITITTAHARSRKISYTA